MQGAAINNVLALPKLDLSLCTLHTKSLMLVQGCAREQTPLQLYTCPSPASKASVCAIQSHLLKVQTRHCCCMAVLSALSTAASLLQPKGGDACLLGSHLWSAESGIAKGVQPNVACFSLFNNNNCFLTFLLECHVPSTPSDIAYTIQASIP